ncbi:pilin [Patescibacteria group bacterium]|nr:pilin [Patescibacteria group bacterium]
MKRIYHFLSIPQVIISIAIFLLIPITVSAECCKCTDPSIQAGVFCIQDTISCSNIKTSGNDNLKNTTCSALTQASQCQQIGTGGGICLNIPISANEFSLAGLPQAAPTASTTTTSEQKPVQGGVIPIDLNVKIPGLQLTDAYEQNGYIVIPYLAQYISAVQKLLIGVGLIAAAIMIVYGGFLYIVSGAGASVREGKKLIIDALVGLVILLSSTVILANVNPKTTQLQTIEIPFIKQIQYQEIKTKHYQAAQNTAQIASLAGGSIADVPISATRGDVPSPAEVLDYARKAASEKGIDPCIAWAVMYAESRGVLKVGHDENYYFGPNVSIPQSRVDFMRSRKFYSGKSFPDDVPIMPPVCTAGNRDLCLKSASYPSKDNLLTNDDEETFDPGNPPDFGLDWRFSHGIGASQATIFPVGSKSGGMNSGRRCSNGWQGYWVGGQCFTVPQLITMEGSVAAMLAHPGFWNGDSPRNDPMATFKAYAGCSDSPTASNSCKNVQAILDLKLTHYNNCKAKYGG